MSRLQKSYSAAREVFHEGKNKEYQGLRSSMQSSRDPAWARQNSSEENPSTTDVSARQDLTLEQSLMDLAELIANITESYTTAVFVADGAQKILRTKGFHTLSRDFVASATIGFGCGLVGWTAENEVRISVCPFEHDATTLLYYACDQGLKSFIAVPILDSRNQLVGVISCDSKKSYAFAKVTEKILLDCAVQAARLIDLHSRLNLPGRQYDESKRDNLQEVLEALRSAEEEEELLSRAADLPADLVERDSLVVITTSECGVGSGVYYTTSKPSRVEHRLLEMVCRHKKIICSERSVHALPVEGDRQRSFLSVPFHVFGEEAGSFNLLSRPYEAFDALEIAALERIASVVGRELERIRLRDRLASSKETTGIDSWKHFSVKARTQIEEARKTREPLTLVRFSLTNIIDIEDIAGVSAATTVLQKFMRLIEQVKRNPAIAGYLYGCQVLMLLESAEVDRTLRRLQRLIERLTPIDLGDQTAFADVEIGKLINSGLVVTSAQLLKDGETLGELVTRTQCRTHLSTRQ